MKIKIVFFLFFYFNSISTNATSIRVLDLEHIIDNHKDMNNLIDKIENDQISHREQFKIKEKDLELELKKINDLKLILENTELDKEINIYNEKLNEYNIKIEKFNFHYENQINILKNLLLKKTLEIIKKYSLDNQIDLILDSNNYILSINSINITNMILEKLNNIKFATEFEKFK